MTEKIGSELFLSDIVIGDMFFLFSIGISVFFSISEMQLISQTKMLPFFDPHATN